jgi:The (Largely Gram-negative Bacterial) Hydrophobe/Amphiphile Efflux-1 (HAE1) Family
MTRFFVNRPTLSLVTYLVLIIGGIFGFINLPVDLLPKFTLPSVSVIIQYPGASPEDVEKNVVDVVESNLSILENIDRITSTSQNGLGVITVTFKYGTDVDKATLEVKDRLNFISAFLPEDASDPLILKFDIQQFPVIIATVNATEEGFDIREWAEEFLVDELQRVEGVGLVQIWGGGKKRRVSVYIHRDKLDNYNLNLQSVIEVLKSQGVDIPVGEVRYSDKDMILKVPQNLKSVEDLKELVVGFSAGRPIKLYEIADVEEGYAKRVNYINSRGKDAVLFAVQKKADANVVSVVEKVKKKFREIEDKYPVKFTIQTDGSTFIKASISNLRNTIFISGILVILITLIFLLDIRSSLIIALTIPSSLIIAFLYLFLTGSSINIISLSALALAIGSVVDSSVVVVENIFYHRLKGEPPREAAEFATNEVRNALIASVITNFIVLLPLFFIPGFIGVIFKELASISVVVYLASLFLALSVTPSLSANQLRLKPIKEPKWFLPIEKFYNRAIKFVVKHRFAFLWVFVALLIITASLWRFVPTEFFPQADEGQIRGSIEFARGTSLDKTYQTILPIIEEVYKIPEVEEAVFRVGPTETGFGAALGVVEAPYTSFFLVRLKEDRKRSTFEIAEEIERLIKELPGVEKYEVSSTGQGNQILFGGSRGAVVRIYGDEIETLDSLANILAGIMRNIRGLKNVQTSLGNPRPEFILKINRDKAYSYGITPVQVALFLRYAITGQNIFTLKSGGKNLEVWVYLRESDRENLDKVLSLSINTPLGLVPLSNFIELQEGYSPIRIDRWNRKRYVEVSGEVVGRPLGEITNELKAILRDFKFPRGYSYEFGGAIQRQAESFSQLFVLLILGLILIYLTVSAQFESFRQGIIIFITSIPFGLAGASLGFLLFKQPLSITGFIGLIALTGVVVNNAIVMVSYANILIRKGKDKFSAIIEASTRRLRPILMTTLTTSFGVLPLAIIKQQGSEFWSALGVAIFGGLNFSLITTLFVVPVIYTYLTANEKKAHHP